METLSFLLAWQLIMSGPNLTDGQRALFLQAMSSGAAMNMQGGGRPVLVELAKRLPAKCSTTNKFVSTFKVRRNVKSPSSAMQ